MLVVAFSLLTTLDRNSPGESSIYKRWKNKLKKRHTQQGDVLIEEKEKTQPPTQRESRKERKRSRACAFVCVSVGSRQVSEEKKTTKQPRQLDPPPYWLFGVEFCAKREQNQNKGKSSDLRAATDGKRAHTTVSAAVGTTNHCTVYTSS